MKFQVILSQEAVEDVLRIAMTTRFPTTVIDAARRLQKALEQNPDRTGYHLSEGLYFVDREPLPAFFTIDDEHATVEIVNVNPT